MLACSLAHIRAVALCAEEGYDVILEDNVRVHKNAPALLADLRAAVVDADADGDGRWLRYFGYLGREEYM